MLNKRIYSALIGIALLTFILKVGGLLFLAAVLVLAGTGLLEFYKFAAAKGVRPYKVVGIVTGLLLLVGIYLKTQGLIVNFNLYLGIISILYILLISNLFKQSLDFQSAIIDTAVTMLGVLYVCGFFLYLILIYNFKLSGVDIGKRLIWLPLLVTWATDTAAYFTGLNLGKNKLAPAISPKKTIEGAVGGLVGSLITVLIFGMWLPLSLFERVILGLLLGIVSQLGDLVESTFKRDAQIKDAGTIIPGHGGILDRFDSLLFVLPVTYYYFQFFS
ncbi:MAG: phosphatidate cytidylyltransferase [Bacillota bacterium]